MNEIITQKRDKFRVELRNKEINNKLQNNRGLMKKTQQDRILLSAQQHNLPFCDLSTLNQNLKEIILKQESLEQIQEALDLFSQQFIQDLEVFHFNQLLFEQVQNIFYTATQNSNLPLILCTIRLLVNATYQLEWACLQVGSQQFITFLVQVLDKCNNKELMFHIYSLLGNLVYENVDTSKQILGQLSQLIHHAKAPSLILEFIKILKNIPTHMIDEEMFKLILNFWINVKPSIELIRETFYQFLRQYIQSNDGNCQIFDLLDENNILQEIIFDFKTFQNEEYVESSLYLLMLISYSDYFYVMKLVNNGVLQAIIVRLNQSMYHYESLFILISNIIMDSKDAFKQANIFGLLKQLSTALNECVNQMQYGTQDEILFCLSKCIELYAFEFIEDFLKYNVHKELINLIISNYYPQREVILSVVSMLTKLLMACQQIELPSSTIKILLNKLDMLAIEEPLHPELISLIDILEKTELDNEINI